MNANEIMTNEEVMEAVTTEIVNGGSKKDVLKLLAGIGITGVVAYAIYRLAKFLIAKRKAKKEQLEAAKVVYPDFDENDLEDENVEDDE